MEKDAENAAIRAMADDVRWLLSHTPADGMRWVGKKNELIELVYEAAATSLLHDELGNHPSRRTLVEQAARVLRLPLPANASSVYGRVKRVESSSYTRRAPMAERYAHMMAQGDTRPILRFLSMK